MDFWMIPIATVIIFGLAMLFPGETKREGIPHWFLVYLGIGLLVAALFGPI